MIKPFYIGWQDYRSFYDSPTQTLREAGYVGEWEGYHSQYGGTGSRVKEIPSYLERFIEYVCYSSSHRYIDPGRPTYRNYTDEELDNIYVPKE